MDAEMRNIDPKYRTLAEAYFRIDPKYRAARSDLFRPYLLYRYGGLWLDLRASPSDVDNDLGLEQIFARFEGAPPPLMLQHDGSHKKKFKMYPRMRKTKFGQISNSWMCSAKNLQVWLEVMKRAINMVNDYHSRASRSADGDLVDNTNIYYSGPQSMTGREGTLCLGPLCSTPVLHDYLSERHVLEECFPKCFQDLFMFSKEILISKAPWCKQQPRVLYREPRDHKHYSQLKDPIIRKGAVDDAYSGQ